MSSERVPRQTEVQLDLFDPRIDLPTETKPTCLQDPSLLTPADLLALVPVASVNIVRQAVSVLVSTQPDGWEFALLKLWLRFHGFGIEKPMIEQELVLRAIADTKASALLKEILATSYVPTCLEGELVRAADACSLALPPDCVLRVLENSDPLKREAAVSLALKSGLTTDHVLPYVTDPNGAVRRKALIRLAKGGERDVRANLLREMMIRPCAEGLEALSDIADDDTIVWFGRVAERHLAWRPKILSILQSIGTTKALRVAKNIL